MLANFVENFKRSTACSKCKSVLSFLFSYIHKEFCFGILKNIDEKFLKFLFVGVLNTLFSYFLYALFVTIGLRANIALIFQYFFGILWNFKTTGTIVFNNSDNKLIFKFFYSYVFTFMLNSLLLYILVEVLKFNDYISQAVLVLPIALISFVILKFWVFKKD